MFGRKFDLQKGEINFVNDKIIVSARGIYSKQGKTIIAEINGENDQYQLTLSSIPVLPDDEILSFIIFGESAQDISAIKAIQLASAIGTLRGGGGGGGFFDPITFTRDTFGFDTFSIDSETTETGESGINIGIGKYINERVYVELERSPSDSQPWKGTIEIELTPKIKLQSTTGGKSGIDSAEIIWSNDY